MPLYNWSVKNIIWEEDVRIFFEHCRTIYEKAFVSILWITGARPGELLELRKEDIHYSENMIQIKMVTEKKREDGSFDLPFRTLEIARTTGFETNIYIETFLKLVEKTPPGQRLFRYSARWPQRVLNKLGEELIGHPISPYHFRHSCMTHMARSGATIDELMHFKGAKSVSSIQPYIHAQPYLIKLENLKRERGAKAVSYIERERILAATKAANESAPHENDQPIPVQSSEPANSLSPLNPKPAQGNTES